MELYVTLQIKSNKERSIPKTARQLICLTWEIKKKVLQGGPLPVISNVKTPFIGVDPSYPLILCPVTGAS